MLEEESGRVGKPHSLDDARADARDGSFDLFVAGRAHDQGASRVDGREEGVAILEAMLEVDASGEDFLDCPGELALLGTSCQPGAVPYVLEEGRG